MDYDKVAKILGITVDSLSSKNWRDLNIDLSDNSNVFGIPTVADDGNKYRSKFEASIANFLVKHSISFEYEKRVCNSKRWTCDFIIGDLWIEADGLGKFRKDAKDKLYTDGNEKIQYYKDNNYNYIILKRNSWKKKLCELLGLK